MGFAGSWSQCGKDLPHPTTAKIMISFPFAPAELPQLNGRRMFRGRVVRNTSIAIGITFVTAIGVCFAVRFLQTVL
jgi:hypothetical protein